MDRLRFLDVNLTDRTDEMKAIFSILLGFLLYGGKNGKFCFTMNFSSKSVQRARTERKGHGSFLRTQTRNRIIQPDHRMRLYGWETSSPNENGKKMPPKADRLPDRHGDKEVRFLDLQNQST